MTSATVGPSRRRFVTLVVAVAVLVGVVAFFAFRTPGTTQAEPQAVETTTAPTVDVSPAAVEPVTSEPAVEQPASTPPATSPAPSPSPTVTGYCQPLSDEGFEPVRYVIQRFGVDEQVVSLGIDAEGAIAAPPKSEPRTASWWNQGPAAGASAGKTVLSIHTYRRGGALGNQLFEGGQSQLQPGDRIVLHGAQGEVACYDFVEAQKIFVEDYDPDSDVMVDYEGDPLLTMIICWDHRAGTDLWDSRVFFYAAPYVGA